MKNLFLFSIILMTTILFSCKDMVVQPATSNQNLADFEATWKRINDVYPFLEFKNIDLDSIYTVYRPQVVEANGDEFYQVFSDLLAELKDGHVYYRTDGGGQVYPYYPQRYFRDRGGYNPFVVRTYFNKELKLTPSGSAEYEILPEDIGYILLSDFHENYLIDEFHRILEYLKNTKGLIIDIRQRRGGSFANIEAVVTRFMSVPLDKPKFYQLGVFYELPQFQPKGPFTYTNNVVVLINGLTFSAGEWTTEILKQLPQVTVIGDTTGGGGVSSSSAPPEAVGDYKLPSGKMIYIGTGYFERYDGKFVEWLGVTPDIRIVQTAEDAQRGQDKQLEYAIDLLK